MSEQPALLSALDTTHFGIRIARAAPRDTAALDAALAYCREQAVRMLILRCAATATPLVHAAGRAACLLMDTLVYYERALDSLARRPAHSSLRMRTATSSDAASAAQLAQACFHGYDGHYHADPLLDRQRCDAAYGDWARRACTPSAPHEEAFVGEIDGRLAAFAAISKGGKGGAMGEGRLFCVAPEFRRRGIYQAMLEEALWRCREAGCARFEISTQITNVPSQAAWTGLGLRLRESRYTFHKWF